MKQIILIFFIILVSCGVKEDYEMKINNSKLSITIKSSSENILFYHIMLKNCSTSKHSIADIFTSETTCLNVFPGKYDIYIYALEKKTESSQKLHSYYTDKNIFINKDICYNINLKALTPKYNLIKDKVNNKIIIKIDFSEYENFLYLSTLSIKNPDNKICSLKPIYNSTTKEYLITTATNIKGNYFINISYSIKSSKKDNSILRQNGYNISTNYFSNLYLCTIN